MKKNLLILILFFSSFQSNAQFSRYIVKFKNKGTSPYSISTPSNYLSARALTRRTNYGISIDSSDLPITPRYIDSVRLAGAVTILNPSKWLNQVSIQTTDNAALAKINSFSFVQSVTGIAARTTNTEIVTDKKNKFSSEEITASISTSKTNSTQDYFSYGNTYNEIHLHNGEFLHNIGMRGQNMLVAVLDAGFFNYTSLKAFDSINANNQVLQTWDFVARHSSVVEDNSHGMSCLSTIAGNIPGTFIGNAPKANFVLYRTEDAPTEYPIEEHNWACGAERADSIGADIISSSLGYTTFDNNSLDYTYSNMNGNTSISAKAAKFIGKKGLLAFIAMGNDGANSWKYLSTAADADSVISVGAVNTSGAVGSFSSYGPSFDGRIKPEMSSVGVNAYVQNSNNTIGTGNGTSYATPKMAGLGTCLWQAFPENNNMAIRDALIKSSSIYSAPNNRIGYGIPNIKNAFILLLNSFAKITATTISNCKTILSFKSKDVSFMKYEIERLIPGQTAYTKIADVQGSGTILSNKTYIYSDTLNNVSAGTIKYRIKQTIDTANATTSFTYFDSVSVNLTTACIATPVVNVNTAIDKITLLPNPAKDFCIIRVTTNDAVKKLSIRITDVKGSVLLQLNKSKNSGTVDYEIPLQKFAKGSYIINVFDDKKMLDHKVLLKL
jgi:serine protease AprX